MVECAKNRFIRTGHGAIPMTPQKLYEKEKKTMANKNMIRIRLKAYDHQLIDKAAETCLLYTSPSPRD